MRARTALAALDQAIEKSLWSYLFRGKKTKARYIKPRPKPAGDGEKAEPVGRLARRIGRNGLPISESRPFRNSWRGASRDLYGAAKGIYKHRRRTMSMTADVLDGLEVAIAKAGMIRAPQTTHRMARGYVGGPLRRVGTFARVSRLKRASTSSPMRGSGKTSHSWGFGRRPDGSIAKAVAAIVEKAKK